MIEMSPQSYSMCSTEIPSSSEGLPQLNLLISAEISVEVIIVLELRLVQTISMELFEYLGNIYLVTK